MKSKTKQLSGALLALIVAALLVLSGCDSGSGGGSDPAPSPENADFDATLDAVVGVAAGVPTYGAIVATGQVSLGLFAAIVEGWDGSTTYTYGSETITVVSANNVWTMTYTDSATSESMIFRIEWNGSTWDISWTVNGDVLLSGTVSNDGLTGNLTFFDPATGDTEFTYVWGAGSTFALGITGTLYTGGVASDRVVVETTLDGSTGTWVYTDLDNSLNNDSGSW